MKYGHKLLIPPYFFLVIKIHDLCHDINLDTKTAMSLLLLLFAQSGIICIVRAGLIVVIIIMKK